MRSVLFDPTNCRNADCKKRHVLTFVLSKLLTNPQNLNSRFEQSCKRLGTLAEFLNIERPCNLHVDGLPKYSRTRLTTTCCWSSSSSRKCMYIDAIVSTVTRAPHPHKHSSVSNEKVKVCAMLSPELLPAKKQQAERPLNTSLEWSQVIGHNGKSSNLRRFAAH